MCGLHFALRSESEHRQLRNSDIEVIERPGEVGYVMYNESTSNNNSGGLKNRKVKPKSVVHHANTENPQHCFVRLRKVYREHRLSSDSMDHDAFYQTPFIRPLYLSLKEMYGIKLFLLVLINCVLQSVNCVKKVASTATKLIIH